MKLLFPDVAVEDFDFSAEWLITAMNADTKQVNFEGQGRNSDLEMVLDFKENSELFESFSVGELVHLDPESFLQAENEPYKPQYEGF
ncbi:hypothetical protein MK435_02470 [Streptococcus oralis]|uniref:hypothetical protein n=1 Tax=Streptococcus TaxID=1301 RepID=UPI0005DAC9AE|nr:MULTISPECIES: hypothetical protein [Streptococcus]MCP9125468.1 hypothetical protein [Streptococcus oralis]MCY7109738.1 hypothetical protein [Streptococcus oralis]CGG36842.1 Uncharacterised protein [Streptococcus pneumoniae]CJQ29706.1 Uncharacterised protein [Streptococcus pneumoniae]CJX78597.1 Uncharacterised protein [Streptococcus pneumoniae]